MSSAHVTYSSHPSATSENEITALAAIYKLCLERSKVSKETTRPGSPADAKLRNVEEVNNVEGQPS